MNKRRAEEKLTSWIQKRALSEGVDLFGVASAEALLSAPEGFRPEDILQGSKAVVIVGKKLSDATVNTAPSRMFDVMYSATNSFLDLLVLKIADAISSQGYRAIAMGPHSWNKGLLRGDISYKHAAVAAGLGRFGLQSLVLTPHYGPRQRWSAVITDAPLEPGAPLEKGLCDPQKCDYACVRSCPAGVFSERKAEGAVQDYLPGGLWYYWNINKKECVAYRAPKREELGLTTLEGHACALCKKVCPVGTT
ncbi:MAG: hypothetical protein K8I29_16075 [Alphaproteobacteria bacterium]|uniref:Epoxyqueuosine reductase n=1 Tax=Candidatus Nitrobium versatile TaxID=2884831 RepID=A0A953M2F3_9BACT|nr:hypothetical protein [Candidatus Nitrobium versatile]